VQTGQKIGPQSETFAPVSLAVSENVVMFQVAVRVFNAHTLAVDTAVICFLLFGQGRFFDTKKTINILKRA
jgi:hypothetical protein